MLPKRVFAVAVVAFIAALAAAVAQAALPVTVVEYYNSTLDHYFITSATVEIAALDGGKTAGWKRTGASFTAFDGALEGTTPVCRIYLPPGRGDSHFYSANAAECA